MRIIILLSIFAGLFLQSCGNDSGKKGTGSGEYPEFVRDAVIIHLLADPENLNPTNYQSADAYYVQTHIFQSLLTYDIETFEFLPQLAKARPTISADGLQFTYELMDAAKWDDGTPVTAEDIIFSLKVIKNPFVPCERVRPYFDLVKDVVVDKANNRKFTFMMQDKYLLAESSLSTELIILQEKLYDPNKILRKFTVPQLCSQKIDNEADLKKFADEYNTEKYMRDANFVAGSGPYKLEKWVTGDQIALVRKTKWWGDDVKDVKALQANPKKIIYKIIKDPQTALTNLKAEQLDVMSQAGLSPKDYIALKGDPNSKYNFSNPPVFAYYYMGMNNRPAANRTPFFTDIKVRKAMAHLVNNDLFIEKLFFGMGERVIGPLFKGTKAYNEKITPVPFDINAAQKLLDAAGWKDTDGNGVRDKVIDGVKKQFEVEIYYNGGNETRKNMAIIIAQDAQKAGIKLKLRPIDPQVLVQKQNNHDFDMYIGGYLGSHQPVDLKQIWHSEYIKQNGSNDVGFSTPETDKLIDQIRIEMDDNKRNAMYHRFQEVVHEQQPVVFLVTPTERFAIHKRFENAKTSALRPGFEAKNFTVKPELVKYP